MDSPIQSESADDDSPSESRRRLLKQLSLGAVISGTGLLAGCSGDGDGGNGTDGDGNGNGGGAGDGNGETDEQMSMPRNDDVWSDTELDVVYDAGTGPLIDLYGHVITDDVGVTFTEQTLPYNQLYEKVSSDFLIGEPSGDIITYPPIFLGDFQARGLFEPLDDHLSQYEGTENFVDETLDPFWEFYCKWDDQVVALPLDGDIFSFNYRPSYFEDDYHKEQFQDETGKELKVPETWPYYNEVARYFTENTEDGIYGTVVHGQRPYCWAFWMCRAASQGAIYFDEDMEPGINTEGAVKALENMVESVEIGPEGTGSYDSSQVINDWTEGKALMSQWWINITQVGPDAPIAGDQALTVMPGWEQDDGSINRNSTISYARVMGIPKALEGPRKEAAFYSAYRMAAPPISTHAITNANMGIEPYMDPTHYSDEAINLLTSEDDLVDPDADTEASGVSFRSKEFAREWMTAQRDNLAIGFPQPNWPGAQQYQEAMGIEIQNALTKEKSPQKALDDLADEMRSIRDELGREEQTKHYEQFLKTAEKFNYV